MSKRPRFASMPWLHYLIVALSLLLTFLAWYFTQSQVDQKRQDQFLLAANNIIELIQERMASYEDALWSGVAVIKSRNGKINFTQWKEYADNLNLLSKYPGINGIGVIHFVKPDDLKSYLKEQRTIRSGYNIYPKHSKNIYLPITYIIPVKGNEKAVGLDMAHETNRYTAAIKAMKTGKAQITGPIILVQDKEKTPGFLFYAPFYRNNSAKTEALREQNFLGMVYAPFIIKKLLVGTLSIDNHYLHIKISDGSFVLYDDQNNMTGKNVVKNTYRFTKIINVYGRKWKIVITGTQQFSDMISSQQPITILICGLIIDALLLFVFIVLSRSNKNAINYADSVTEELKERAHSLSQLNIRLNKTKNRLEKVARYDAVTGLPNRHSFITYLKKSLARTQYTNTLVCVCFADINNFKIINDNVGHDRGDQILKYVADRFNKNLRDVDYIARFAGDQFAIVIEQVASTAEIVTVLERYFSLFDESIEIKGYKFKMTLTVGVAMFPSAGKTPEELLKNADIALYRAKKSGKLPYYFYNERSNKEIKRYQELELGLQTAIENDEFSLVYQPQIKVSDKSLVGVEALIRWYSDKLGSVSPEEFIPIAEKSLIIKEIGLWAFRQLILDYPILTSISEILSISINLSIRQMEDDSWIKQVIEIMRAGSIDFNKIHFEITETAAMRAPEMVVTIMKNLKHYGIKFDIDDFGVGNSSLAYLKKMPFDVLKIDKSFISDIDRYQSDAAIISTIISLSKIHNVAIIAEGVETASQYEFLKKEGCDMVQGYYFDKPLPIKVFKEKYKR